MGQGTGDKRGFDAYFSKHFVTTYQVGVPVFVISSVFRFGLWCLMPLSAIFQLLWRSVLLVEETGVPGKTTNLPQVTDKLYHIMLY